MFQKGSFDKSVKKYAKLDSVPREVLPLAVMCNSKPYYFAIPVAIQNIVLIKFAVISRQKRSKVNVHNIGRAVILYMHVFSITVLYVLLQPV